MYKNLKIINFENYIKVILSDNGTTSQSSLKSKKIKLDFKDSKYATGRRKKSIKLHQIMM